MDLQQKVDEVKNLAGNPQELVVRNLMIGNESSIEAVIIYINGLVNNNIIDRDILNPLMLHVRDNLMTVKDIGEFIYKKYVAVSGSTIEQDMNIAVDSIKRGKTLLMIENYEKYIVIDTCGGEKRSIEEPANNISLRGPREGFVENLQVNFSMIRRKIKDKSLKTEKFILGRRSQTDLLLVYLDDVVNKEYLEKLKQKVSSIDIDAVNANSYVEQYISENGGSIFPQVIGNERPDVVVAQILEGRIALLLDGTSYVTTYPTVFTEFFQTEEDYYGRYIQTNFIRILRIIAVFVVITFPAIYITLIKFNSELIPIEFIKSLIEARSGIALTPFMSLLAMEFTIELLREGGLRLPGKIGQTLSVVGGIIIGDAALKAKIVSSATLLVAGICTVASFVISNYQMAIAIRTLTYPMLILSNWLGVLGIVLGWFFIIAYLCSLENLGVEYFSIHKNDIKDTIFKFPLKKMNKRPQSIPNSNATRQSNTGKDKNE